MSIKKQALELLSLCIDLSDENFTANMSYNANTKSICLSVYDTGYGDSKAYSFFEPQAVTKDTVKLLIRELPAMKEKGRLKLEDEEISRQERIKQLESELKSLKGEEL